MKYALLLVVSFLVKPSFAEEKIHGLVNEVIDGNTILIRTPDREEYKILLHGIESPEPGQHYSEQSKKMLERLLLNKAVTIVFYGKDRAGNHLGEIRIDGAPDPRHELIKAGLAWTSEKAAIPELETLKDEARQKNLGLWQEANPIPPWVYRRQQSMLEAKSS